MNDLLGKGKNGLIKSKMRAAHGFIGFYKGLRDFDTRCGFLTVGRQMTLNALHCWPHWNTTAQFHHSPGTKLSSITGKQHRRCDQHNSTWSTEFPNVRDSRSWQTETGAGKSFHVKIKHYFKKTPLNYHGADRGTLHAPRLRWCAFDWAGLEISLVTECKLTTPLRECV